MLSTEILLKVAFKTIILTLEELL